MKKIAKYILGSVVLLIAVGFLLPEPMVIPVDGATSADWNHETFWYEPWGRSGVHKGIDIFARKGTDLLSATHGIVVYSGTWGRGGNVLAVLGPRWRLHYYAHLDSSVVEAGQVVAASQVIGKIGDSGNARGKPPHLHYSIVTLFPYPWRWDSSTQGWKKMFFLDPGEKLLGG